MPTIPQNHIEDALKLQVDGKVHLFELMPLSGGTIYFKSDDPFTYLGNEYEGLPCAITGEEVSTDKMNMPRLQIGQENVDLLPFKGPIHDRLIDGATVVRHKVLLDDMINQRDVKETSYFRVKRIESYSRTGISLVLASFSAAQSQNLPFRQYIPPDFPWVDL